MEFDQFTREKKTIDLAKANVEALKYFVLFIFIFAGLYYLIWGFQLPDLDSEYLILKAFAPLMMILVGIAFHELIHGIFFAIFASKGTL